MVVVAVKGFAETQMGSCGEVELVHRSKCLVFSAILDRLNFSGRAIDLLALLLVELSACLALLAGHSLGLSVVLG
jgi:hypothetical protein